MGENKKYYYIKRKAVGRARPLNFFSDRPKVVLHPVHRPVSQMIAGDHVLDMEFSGEKPRLWVGLLRWTLFTVLALLVYITGMLLYAGSGSIKESLVRKGEAATANLQQGAAAFQKLDIETALVNFKSAQRNFDQALGLFAELGQSNILLANLTLPNSQLWQSQSLLQAGRHLATAGVYLTDGIKPLVNYWGGLTAMGGNMQNSGEAIGKLLLDNSRKIDIALAEVRLADKALQSLSIQNLDPAYANLVTDAKDKTAALREAIEIIGNLAKRLPKALGFNTPQYYLLLNQNSNELRPTGGFIGSVTLVKVYHGKIEQISADTAQRLDGQNKYSGMELPVPLKAITAYYGIRDANWEPNFPTSVSTIEKLYQQAGGGSVDGVIALTPKVITDILAVVGPIAMPAYGFDLGPDNFVAKTQQQIAAADLKGYNPKQVLIDFVPVLMNRLVSATPRELREIGNRLFQRMVSKDILLYFNDAKLEAVVASLGWSGEIRPITETEDYLFAVDANLAGNKSSGAIVKEMFLRAKVKSDAIVIDNLSIKYTHTGTDTFPDGISKNYVRIYLPMGSRITQTAGRDADTQVDIDSSDGKTVVGFWLTIKPGETKEITLEYELPFRLKFINGQADYRLIVQKQSGSDKTVFSSYIEVADNMDLAVSSGAEAIRKDMIFSDKLVKDETIATTVRKYR